MSLKRLVDVALAFIALSIASPAMIGIAIIGACQGGPVLYRQRRLGQSGQAFTLLKFRSMRVDAPGPQLTVGGDPRITPLGRVLRRTKLDELPQLLNVLRGHMSLVGPRPEVPEYIDETNPAHRAVLAHRPGLTDPASLAFWNEAELLARAADPERFYRTVILPAKHELSLYYLRDATFWTDMTVLFWTLCGTLAVVRPGSLPMRLRYGARSALLHALHDAGAGLDAALPEPSFTSEPETSSPLPGDLRRILHVRCHSAMRLLGRS